jgi:hypothetical protein
MKNDLEPRWEYNTAGGNAVSKIIKGNAFKQFPLFGFCGCNAA